MVTFLNHYFCCHCRRMWANVWNCACNDKCASCGKEMEPYLSKDIQA